MSRRRQGLSPTLFPFLAVLVCTLGTLILLLALVAQDAQQSAQQLVDAEAESARQLADQAEFEAAELIAYRERKTTELERNRSELAHLEDHLRRLREELMQLKQESELASSTVDPRARAEQAASQLTALEEKLATTRSELESLRGESREGRPPRIVIVPHRGVNGTERRPIYVECTDAAIILQPEGVRITAEQLSGSLGPGNPVDAALRAIRNHWQKLDPEAPPPYPLLMVRPDGIHAYAACRIAMDAWDDQFGYELIPAEMELAFPDPDPLLQTKLVATIDEAARRSRAQLAAGGRQRYNRYAAGPGRSTRGNGGASGTVGRTGQGADSSPDRSGGTAGDDRGRAAADSATEAIADGAHRGGVDGGRLQLHGPQRGADGSSAGKMVAPTANDAAVATAGQRFTGGGESGSRSAAAKDSGAPGEMAHAGQFAEPGDFPQLADSNYSGPSLLAAENVGRTGSAPTRNPNAAPGGSDTGTGQDEDVGTTSNPLGESGGQRAAGAVQPNGAGSGSASAAPGQRSISNQGAAGYASAASGAQPPQTFSEAIEQRAQVPRGASSSRRPPRLPALSSENNWALPDTMRTARGPTMVRELRLDCAADRFVLAGGRTGEPVTVPIRNGLVEQAVRELAKQLRATVSAWGPAMRGGRWEPVLSVRVLPGGEARMDQLEMLMRGSGIRVERRSQP